MSIEEIRKRREAIDGAPWKYEKPGQTVWGHSRGGCNKELSDYQVANIRGWGHLQYMGIERGDAKAAALQDANGEFIAHAPADIDALLAETERLRAQLFRANSIIGWMMPYIGSMCPPDNGIYDLNLHCFENRVPEPGADTKGAPVRQQA